MQNHFKDLGRDFYGYAMNPLVKCVRVPDLKNIKPNSELFKVMRWKVPFRFIKLPRLNDAHLNMDESIHKMLIFSTQKDASSGTKKMINALKSQILKLEKDLIRSENKVQIQNDILTKRTLLDSMVQKDAEDAATKLKIGTVARKVYKTLINNSSGSEWLYNEICLHGRSTEETDANVKFMLANSARDKRYTSTHANANSGGGGSWKEQLKNKSIPSDVKKYIPPSKNKALCATNATNVVNETETKRNGVSTNKYVPPSRKSTADQVEEKKDEPKNVYVPPNCRRKTTHDDATKQVSTENNFIKINSLVDFDNEFPKQSSKTTKDAMQRNELWNDDEKSYTCIAEYCQSNIKENTKENKTEYNNIVGTMGKYKLIVNATTSEKSENDTDTDNDDALKSECVHLSNKNNDDNDDISETEEEIQTLTLKNNQLLNRTWKFTCPSPFVDVIKNLNKSATPDHESQYSRSNSTSYVSENSFECDDEMSFENSSFKCNYVEQCDINYSQDPVEECNNSIIVNNDNYFESYIDDSFSDCE